MGTENVVFPQPMLLGPRVTTRIRGIPAELPLGRDDGLPRPCVANLDTITTIDKVRLEELIGPLSPGKLAAFDHALRYTVGLR